MVRMLRLLIEKLSQEREAAEAAGRLRDVEEAERAIRRQAVRLGYLLRAESEDCNADPVALHV